MKFPAFRWPARSRLQSLGSHYTGLGDGLHFAANDLAVDAKFLYFELSPGKCLAGQVRDVESRHPIRELQNEPI